MKGPNILTLDTETAPIDARIWGIFQPHVDLSRITQDWAILSWAAKWLGKATVRYQDTFYQPEQYDDRKILLELWSLLAKADIVVGHNLARFDMRKIRARMIQLGLPPFKEPVVVDTMLMARSIGSFTSNKLEYLSAELTDSPKEHHRDYPGFELWRAYLARDSKARAAMERYNKQDVRGTEKLYLALRPWVKAHPNVAVYYDRPEDRCPRCGSEDLQDVGEIHRGVSTYTRFSCGKCGGHCRTRGLRSKNPHILTPC